MASPLSNHIYPAPTSAYLLSQFKGWHIGDLPTPSAIIDYDVLKRNCERMLQATEALGMGFRPHVKTHKVRMYSRVFAG